jgi:membrane fusion protein (multidrug efflux system)
MTALDDAEEGARQSAFRAGYRTGFGDGFQAADKVRDAAKGQDEAEPAEGKAGAAAPGDAHAGQDAKKDDGKPPLYKRPLAVLVAIVVVIGLVVAGTLFFMHSRSHEVTDDAFVDGQASQMAAQAPGRVVRLYVKDNQQVRRGDPLVDIDAADIQARVDQAQAGVLTAESRRDEAAAQVAAQKAGVAQAQAAARQAGAEATNAQQDLARFKDVDPDAVSRQQYDQAFAQARAARARLDAARGQERTAQAQVQAAEAQVRVAQAQVATARADLQAAQLQLGYTHVVAPIDGRVTKRAVEVGNVIAVGQPILALVGDDLWVTANFKETQLAKMHPGQAVAIAIDAYPDVEFAGHVDSVQRATGAYFSMLPAENATGNYVKVTQRVPVKITFDRPEDVRRRAIGPGMSVKPSVALD